MAPPEAYYEHVFLFKILVTRKFSPLTALWPVFTRIGVALGDIGLGWTRTSFLNVPKHQSDEYFLF